MKNQGRKSSIKYRRQFGFLTRMKSRNGRKVIKNQRRRRLNIKTG